MKVVEERYLLWSLATGSMTDKAEATWDPHGRMLCDHDGAGPFIRNHYFPNMPERSNLFGKIQDESHWPKSASVWPHEPLRATLFDSMDL